MGLNWRISVPLALISAISTYSYLQENAQLFSPEKSKTAPWPQAFKQAFVDQCAARAPASEKPAFLKECGCLANRMESAHVVQTMYNPIFSSNKEFSEKVSKEVNDYIASPAGRAAEQECQL